jgi:hypothetical protein
MFGHASTHTERHYCASNACSISLCCDTVSPDRVNYSVSQFRRTGMHTAVGNVHLRNVSRLGGVVVSVLTTGPKGRGFKHGRGDEYLRAIKISSTPSFRWEVKPEVPCRKILRHVEDPLTYQRYWIRKILITSSNPPIRSSSLCLQDYQRALVDKSGVITSRHHHHGSPLTFTGGWTIGQWWPRFWVVNLTPSWSINQYQMWFSSGHVT